MQKKIEQAAEAAKVPNPEVALLKQEVVELKRRLDRDLADLKQRLDKSEERAAKAVTDDEFEAYTTTTNKSVQALTEKIGSATGAIEAWYRLSSRGT
jgi:hypothetical protein